MELLTIPFMRHVVIAGMLAALDRTPKEGEIFSPEASTLRRPQRPRCLPSPDSPRHTSGLMIFLGIAIRSFVVLLAMLTGIAQAHASDAKPATDTAPEKIATYKSRFGRTRPVIAVIGENLGTETTDYIIPYGVLTQSGAAEVVAVAIQPGPIQLMPALKIEAQATIDAFDARFPQGADYVIVPAVHKADDPVLVGWVAGQGAKGATVIGVCDGVWVVANTGLLAGHRATGHWYSLNALERKFTDTKWLRNRRYVADGSIVTTTGVTASIPASLALVEAIAGRDLATTVARELGAPGWSPAHDSNDFRLGARHIMTVAGNTVSFWSHQDVGILIAPGTDEIALALVADAYSRTYLSQAVSVSQSSGVVRTRRGLDVIPDLVAGASKQPALILPSFQTLLPVSALNWALGGIADSYGYPTAAWVALQIEYPWQ